MLFRRMSIWCAYEILFFSLFIASPFTSQAIANEDNCPHFKPETHPGLTYDCKNFANVDKRIEEYARQACPLHYTENFFTGSGVEPGVLSYLNDERELSARYSCLTVFKYSFKRLYDACEVERRLLDGFNMTDYQNSPRDIEAMIIQANGAVKQAEAHKRFAAYLGNLQNTRHSAGHRHFTAPIQTMFNRSEEMLNRGKKTLQKEVTGSKGGKDLPDHLTHFLEKFKALSEEKLCVLIKVNDHGTKVFRHKISDLMKSREALLDIAKNRCDLVARRNSASETPNVGDSCGKVGQYLAEISQDFGEPTLYVSKEGEIKDLPSDPDDRKRILDGAWDTSEFAVGGDLLAPEVGDSGAFIPVTMKDKPKRKHNPLLGDDGIITDADEARRYGERNLMRVAIFKSGEPKGIATATVLNSFDSAGNPIRIIGSNAHVIDPKEDYTYVFISETAMKENPALRLSDQEFKNGLAPDGILTTAANTSDEVLIINSDVQNHPVQDYGEYSTKDGYDYAFLNPRDYGAELSANATGFPVSEDVGLGVEKGEVVWRYGYDGAADGRLMVQKCYAVDGLNVEDMTMQFRCPDQQYFGGGASGGVYVNSVGQTIANNSRGELPEDSRVNSRFEFRGGTPLRIRVGNDGRREIVPMTLAPASYLGLPMPNELPKCVRLDGDNYTYVEQSQCDTRILPTKTSGT